MRAFSTIEILIACAILSIGIIAVSFTVYGIPFVLTDMQTEYEALGKVQGHLSRTILNESIFSTSSASSSDVASEPLEDETYRAFTANASWKNILGHTQNLSLQTITASSSNTDDVCDPFFSGDWTRPTLSNPLVVRTGTSTSETFPVGNLLATQSGLVASITSTTNSNSPTLFFYLLTASGTPELKNTFDNAASSRIGFSALALGRGKVYAGNGFGSASTSTCNELKSCSQVQVFSSSEDARGTYVSSLRLSTTSPPYAVISGGNSAPVQSLAFYNDLLYVGLQKTVSGDEFNIIDAQDPTHLTWVSGIPIGRTINGITVRGTNAYLATDDPLRELIIVNVADPTHPFITGSWDAPGSSGFGYGITSTSHNNSIRFDRTYVSNAPEFALLDATDPAQLILQGSNDLGPASTPQSVRALITQDAYTFVLANHSLHIFRTDSKTLSEKSSSITFGDGLEATSLTCRGNRFFIGEVRNDGAGIIQSITGS